MRSQKEVVKCYQFIICLRRLRAVYIEACRTDLVLRQCNIQCFFIYDSASCCIDQAGIIFHHLKLFGRDHISGRIKQRHMKGNIIAGADDLLLRSFCYIILCSNFIRNLKYIISKYIHPPFFTSRTVVYRFLDSMNIMAITCSATDLELEPTVLPT